MRPIVTFNDVFEKCRLENAHSEIKRRARESMLTFFEHLKHESIIKNFKLTKKVILSTLSNFPTPRPRK